MKINVVLVVLLFSLPITSFGQNQAPVVDLSSSVPEINPLSDGGNYGWLHLAIIGGDS